MKSRLSFESCSNTFSLQMETLRNNRKLMDVNGDCQKEHPRNNFSRDLNVPRVNDQYFMQVSVEIETRVTANFSPDYSATEGRILVSLSELDEFILN